MYYDMNNKQDQKKLMNLKIIKSLGINQLSGYNNLAYIDISIQEIEVSKKLFVFGVELGDEATIPGILS